MKFLAWHLGLGDALAFADLAVKLADGEAMMVPCYAHNEVSVRSLFVNYPNIMVVDCDPVFEGLHGFDMVPLGHYSGIPRNEGEDMIEWVYRTAGLLPDDRFDDRVVEKAAEYMAQNPISPETQAIIHEDLARGFTIRRPEHVWLGHIVDMGGPILQWANIVEQAPEIHVIDSAFLHLVEQLQPTGKLYYHRYARPGSEAYRTLRHPWIVLE